MQKAITILVLSLISIGSIWAQNCQSAFTYSPAGISPFQINFTNNSTFTGVISSDSITYDWDFDDGTASLSTNPIHVYSAPGTYYVCLDLIITDSIGNPKCSSSFCDSIVISNSPSCQASFSWSPDSLTPSTIDFTDLSSSFGIFPGNLTRSTWGFGDGILDSSFNGTGVSHSYAQAGSYLVCLLFEVIDTTSAQVVCMDTVCQIVNVTIPVTCNANFTFSINSINPKSVEFRDSSSHQSPAVGFTDSISWDFGDGSPIQFGDTVSYTYASAQTYIVCQIINVFNNQGNLVCTDSICKQVVIIPDTGFCNVSYIIDTVNSYPGNVYIWNMSNPANNDPNFVNSYFWDFGDGSSSSQAYPTHNYSGPGSYALCLTLISTNQNLDTCKVTYCDSIIVDVNGNLNGIGSNGFVLRVLNPETISILENPLRETKIYPNPANRDLHLEFPRHFKGSVNWNIIDFSGGVVLKGTRNLKEIEKITIDVLGLKPGMYILSIENEFSVYHNKLEINRW